MKVRKTLTLSSKSDIDWLEERYGPDSASWIVSGLLEQFRKAHTHTPQDYMKAGAESLKELVEERLV